MTPTQAARLLRHEQRWLERSRERLRERGGPRVAQAPEVPTPHHAEDAR